MLTRAGLVSSINAMNLLALVPPEVRALYDLMTQDFAPLEMAGKLEPLLAQVTAVQVRRGGEEGGGGLAACAGG